MRIIYQAKSITGTITLPGDKSIAHRAIILSAMGEGKSSLTDVPESADCRAACSLLKNLGVNIKHENKGNLCIHGVGMRGFKEPVCVLNAGNSGTLARLMAGVLAGQSFVSIMTGDTGLRKRPMGRVVRPLEKMGAVILGSASGDRLPLAIKGGKLRGITYDLPVASAQVKSALLFAALLAKEETYIKEPAPSRDHTERMLEALGIPIRYGEGWCRISSGKQWGEMNFKVPGDISSAAPFVVASLLLPGSHLKIREVGLNPRRIQYLETLCKMGGDIRWTVEGEDMGERWGSIEVKSSRLTGISIDVEKYPGMIDEVPLLALAASQSSGETHINGIRELIVKESNRLLGIVKGLENLGADVMLLDDKIVIKGPVTLLGCTGLARGDHRMAMWYAIAGLISKAPVILKGEHWVSTSFPLFWNILDGVVEY